MFEGFVGESGVVQEARSGRMVDVHQDWERRWAVRMGR